MRRIGLFTSVAFITLILFQQGRAQDTHYWTYQYGTRAVLLGGQVIGSILDISGIYYNPGGLGLLEDPETLLAAKVFHWPRYSIEGLAGTNRSVTSSIFDTAPGIVAGLLKFSWLKDHRIGYSIISRQSVDMRFSTTVVASGDAIPDYSGNESIIAGFQLNEKLSEPWWGLTWAYKINDSFGIGISNYVSFRSHRANFQVVGQSLAPNGELAMFVDSISYDYRNYRLLWKIGGAFNLGRIQLGLTLTTPSIELYGTGAAGINKTITGTDLDKDGTKDTIVIADYQEGLDSDFPTPFVLGIGATYKLAITKLEIINLYASAEWYSGIRKFDVIKTKEFVGQSDGKTYRTEITHELDDVLNYGLGIEYVFNKNITLYGSITTDFSARKPGSDTNLSVTDWDIYHLSTGATFRVKNTEWTLGLGYAWGDRKKRRTDSLDPEVENKFKWYLNNVNFKYDSIKFLFGFSF